MVAPRFLVYYNFVLIYLYIVTTIYIYIYMIQANQLYIWHHGIFDANLVVFLSEVAQKEAI